MMYCPDATEWYTARQKKCAIWVFWCFSVGIEISDFQRSASGERQCSLAFRGKE